MIHTHNDSFLVQGTTFFYACGLAAENATCLFTGLYILCTSVENVFSWLVSATQALGQRLQWLTFPLLLHTANHSSSSSLRATLPLRRDLKEPTLTQSGRESVKNPLEHSPSKICVIQSLLFRAPKVTFQFYICDQFIVIPSRRVQTHKHEHNYINQYIIIYTLAVQPGVA